MLVASLTEGRKARLGREPALLAASISAKVLGLLLPRAMMKGFGLSAMVAVWEFRLDLKAELCVGDLNQRLS